MWLTSLAIFFPSLSVWVGSAPSAPYFGVCHVLVSVLPSSPDGLVPAQGLPGAEEVGEPRRRRVAVQAGHGAHLTGRKKKKKKEVAKSHEIAKKKNRGGRSPFPPCRRSRRRTPRPPRCRRRRRRPSRRRCRSCMDDKNAERKKKTPKLLQNRSQLTGGNTAPTPPHPSSPCESDALSELLRPEEGYRVQPVPLVPVHGGGGVERRAPPVRHGQLPVADAHLGSEEEHGKYLTEATLLHMLYVLCCADIVY